MSDEQKTPPPPDPHSDEPTPDLSTSVPEPVSYSEEDTHTWHPDPHAEPYTGAPYPGAEPEITAITPVTPPPTPPSVSSESSDDEDDDDEGMLRMSFLEHLEELRSRLIRALSGLAIAFFLCLYFSNALWRIVQEPAKAALTELGYKDAGLVYTSPMEGFTIIWMKLPLMVSVFVASPWILYQAWGFIAPGLYKKERRLAAPFVLSTAGLFITGGLFAYYVAFRFGLSFLLGIGRDVDVRPMVTITEYFDIFVNVILGVAVVFELPVLIFFLTLLRIASPRFLLTHSRYAILAIFILAAIITPTPDVFNLMLFAVPMVLLYFFGIFASYLLVMSREGKKLPWLQMGLGVLVGLVLIGAGLYVAVTRYGFKFIPHWPFLIR